MALVTSQPDKTPVVESKIKSRGTAQFVGDSLLTGVMFALALTIFQRIIGFVRGILFCRMMTDQQLGQWSMVWSFLLLLAPLAMLGLPGCFGKYCEYFKHRGQLRTFVYRVAWVSLSTTAVVALAMVLFPAYFANLFFRDASQQFLIRCVGIALFAVAVNNYFVSLMEALRQVRLVTIMRFITGVGFALLGTLMLMTWNQDSSAVTIAYAVCCVLGISPAVWLLWKFRDVMGDSQQALPRISMWQQIAPFAIWLWVSNLLHNLFEITDRYMLIHWSDTPAEVAQAMVGQYHSGRVVPLLLVSVAAMLAGLLLPYMSAAWEENRKSDAARQLNWTVKLVGITFTLGGILILMGAPILFDWILQGRYNDGLAVLPMTLVYCIWFSLFTVGQDFLWVAEKGKWATAGVGIGLVANIVLNTLLIPTMGISGAVLATTCGNAVAIFLIFCLNHRWDCKTDAGIWIMVALPLILLLPVAWASLVFLAISIGCVWSNLIFNREEKKQLVELFAKAKTKIESKLSS